MNKSNKPNLFSSRPYSLFLFIACCLILSACATDQRRLEAMQRAKWELDRKFYESYEERNTIEGYEEFIKKDPENVYIDKARQNLEKARQRAELINCDTAECLKEFLAKHPASDFSQEAEAHMQELEVGELDRQLKEEYSFDLLLYRLEIRRLRQELTAGGKEALGDFTGGFSFEIVEGKRYFCTRLTFRDESMVSNGASEEITEEIFDYILAGELEYLNIKFKKKEKIDGFRFELASSDPASNKKKVLLVLHFPLSEVDLFAAGRLEKKAFMKKARVVAPSPIPLPIRAEATAGLERRGTEPVPVKWASSADGLAKNGRFVRTAPPAFRFEYPKDWSMEGLSDKYVFNGGNASGTHSIRVMTTKITGKKTAYIKSFAGVCSRQLQETGSNINVLYNKPTDLYEGYPAYEFEIRYRPKGKGTAGVRTCYGNVIAKGGFAVILEGETSGDIDTLRTIYETIDLKFAGGSPEGPAQTNNSRP